MHVGILLAVRLDSVPLQALHVPAAPMLFLYYYGLWHGDNHNLINNRENITPQLCCSAGEEPDTTTIALQPPHLLRIHKNVSISSPICTYTRANSNVLQTAPHHQSQQSRLFEWQP